MISEGALVQRYLGARFGLIQNTPDGVYAIPCDTSKGKAFMKIGIKNAELNGVNNFCLYWDEKLTISWYTENKPMILKESDYSKAFRKLEKLNQ